MRVTRVAGVSQSTHPLRRYMLSMSARKTGSRHTVGTHAVVPLLLISGITHGNEVDSLERGFAHPPNEAQPRVWWHWVSGNVSRSGIKDDLEWMHRSGIGGIEIFDVDMGIPQVVPTNSIYMTTPWKKLFRYALKVADHLGLEVGISSAPGFSETGGPWVQPDEAMKKYVWSETVVDGGKPYDAVLKHPPMVAGPFQGLAAHDGLWEFLHPGTAFSMPAFYRDIAVIAYRIPSAAIDDEAASPIITSSDGSQISLKQSSAKSLKAEIRLSRRVGDPVPWIQFEFPQPREVRALRIEFEGGDDWALTEDDRTGIQLESSQDGVSFHEVSDISTGEGPHTVSFAPVHAKYFRIEFGHSIDKSTSFAENQDIGWLWHGLTIEDAQNVGYKITDVEFDSDNRVNHFEEKAGFFMTPALYRHATPNGDVDSTISSADIVDLTAKMQPDGHLNWTPPSGKWMILRFGASLTGAINHPAAAQSTGLEVDKLNRTSVQHYLDRYLGDYLHTVGQEKGGRLGIKFLTLDSWEAGPQNWTEHLLDQFESKRGYDPRPWMPVLAGRVVESGKKSDQFLWDFRKTISDLVVEEHYREIATAAKHHGMGLYGQSHEEYRAFLGDGMEAKKYDDIPMGAMWSGSPGRYLEQYGYNADDRETASVAHIYGRRLAAAESMTTGIAPFGWVPSTLKVVADREFAQGINQVVIHCSVHQPLRRAAPGFGLGPFGQWFTRNETWADEARAWVTYLARSSYLLQQGQFSADILYYYGEDSNITAVFADKAPDIPQGYAYDYVNADALVNELSASPGELATRSGLTYRLLVLEPNSRSMTLPVLRKIKHLVTDGANLVGPKPLASPSLTDNDMEFKSLVESLWGTNGGRHTVGKGLVFNNLTTADALRQLDLGPDFSYVGARKDARLEFVHRKLLDGEIYYIDNLTDHIEQFDALFRSVKGTPEAWHADTGERDELPFRRGNGALIVPMRLQPWEAVFVVIRASGKRPGVKHATGALISIGTISGPWSVTFPPGTGAPPSVSMKQLISWSRLPQTGAKYFSGSATYGGTLQVPTTWLSQYQRLWIDLGRVKELARLTVNGRVVGVTWHSPFRLELTGLLKPGTNRLTIKVTNTWVNRLIGDEQTDSVRKYAFTVGHPYRANSPVPESGLLGPLYILGSK